MQLENEISPLFEMARIGYVDDLELIVWTDAPEKIPFFHLRDKRTRGVEFNSCIRVDRPEYFKHTGKEDTLNNEQKKRLVSFLNAESPFGTVEITNWNKIIMYWNDNNPAHILDADTPMPDYLLL